MPVNEYQQKLGSKRAHHMLHWPYINGLAVLACVWLRATEIISSIPWALEADNVLPTSRFHCCSSQVFNI